jgi:hypothetical protein
MMGIRVASIVFRTFIWASHYLWLASVMITELLQGEKEAAALHKNLSITSAGSQP